MKVRVLCTAYIAVFVVLCGVIGGLAGAARERMRRPGCLSGSRFCSSS